MAKTTPVNPAKTDPLYDHHRINLSNFIKDPKFFGGMKEKQDKAAVIYKKMMSSEKELKEKKGKGSEHIQQMPSTFNQQEFTTKTKDNPLTAALKENFDKGTTNKAAWDYMTLKQSVEELEKLKQPKGPNGNSSNPPAGKPDQGKDQGATSGPSDTQAGNEEAGMVDRRDEEIERLNRMLDEGRPSDVVALEARNRANERMISHLNIQIDFLQQKNREMDRKMNEALATRDEYESMSSKMNLKTRQLEAKNKELEYDLNDVDRMAKRLQCDKEIVVKEADREMTEAKNIQHVQLGPGSGAGWQRGISFGGARTSQEAEKTPGNRFSALSKPEDEGRSRYGVSPARAGRGFGRPVRISQRASQEHEKESALAAARIETMV